MAVNSRSSKEINELIKIDGELENMLTNQLETLGKCQKLDSFLNHSNWSVTNSLQNITKLNKYLSEKIKKAREDYENYNNKLKLVKSKKSELFQMTWQQFMQNSEHYQHLILSAQQEYSPEKLISDIHQYDIIFEKLTFESLNITNDIEKLTAQYWSSELETNGKVKQLKNIQSFIDSLKRDQLPMSMMIRNHENEKNSILKKMKQKESNIKDLMSQRKE